MHPGTVAGLRGSLTGGLGLVAGLSGLCKVMTLPGFGLFPGCIRVPQAPLLSPLGCSWGPQRVCTALIVWCLNHFGWGDACVPQGPPLHSSHQRSWPAPSPSAMRWGAMSFAAPGLVQHWAHTYTGPSLESSSWLGCAVCGVRGRKRCFQIPHKAWHYPSLPGFAHVSQLPRPRGATASLRHQLLGTQLTALTL